MSLIWNDIMSSNLSDNLQKALKLVGIDENEWNALNPDQRRQHRSFKKLIRAAQLKYHPDRIALDNPDIKADERETNENNIKLINSIDYDVDTLSASQPMNSTTPNSTTAEEFFHDFKESIAASIGENKPFKNWQEAYEHYFSKPTLDEEDYSDVYSRPVEASSPDYQQEFDIALKKGIYDQFVSPGILGQYGSAVEILHPSFRKEESLLIKICKYQRHTHDEDTVISVAAPELQQKESFWRAAIEANPKAIISLARLVEENKKEYSKKIELPIQALLQDKDLMVFVFLHYPQSAYHITTVAPDLSHINGPLAELIIGRNHDNIVYFSLDTGNSEEMNAYQNRVERAWNELPQKSPFQKGEAWRWDYRLSPSRQEFLKNLQEPFKQSAKELFKSTEKLINDLDAYISTATIDKQKQSSIFGRGMFNLFSPAIDQKLEEKIMAATKLLKHLINNPVTSKPTDSDFNLLSQTTLKDSVEGWQQSKQNIFNEKPDAPEQETPRSR